MPNQLNNNGLLINEKEAERRFHRSEMVTDIVSSKPGFWVNNGMGIFLGVLILVFAATWFIKFPEIVSAPAKFTSVNAPKVILAKNSGRLVKLFAKEDSRVKVGDILGFMESTTNHSNVLELEKVLIEIDTQLHIIGISSFSSLNLPLYNTLGELQPDYENFQIAVNEIKNYSGSGFFIKKRQMLLKDLNFLQQMKQSLLQQKKLSSEDLNLSHENFKAHEQLNNQKVIADLDYRNEKSRLIGKKLSIPQINAAIIGNEAQQNEKQKEIAQLEKEIGEQKNKIQQSIHSLKSRIEAWKSQFILSAPVSGTVKFAGFLQENQQLQVNQPICFINPDNSMYFAETYIPQSNFGKLNIGQSVLLKLPSYPFEEFGAIRGKLEFISNIPSDSGYLAKITLINGLYTNYNKPVQFREGLFANAQIITKEMNLLQKMYYGLVKKIN